MHVSFSVLILASVFQVYYVNKLHKGNSGTLFITLINNWHTQRQDMSTAQLVE